MSNSKLFILTLVLSIFFPFGSGICELEIHDNIDFKLYEILPEMEKLPGMLFENPAKHHFFVNFEDNDYPKHHKILESNYLKIIDYIPQSTYMVASECSISKLKFMENLRFEIIEFFPVYKIVPGLLGFMSGEKELTENEIKLLIILFKGSDKDAISKKIGNIVDVESVNEFRPDPNRIVVKCSKSKLKDTLIEISLLEEVYLIEKMGRIKLHNYEASWFGQSGIIHERPIWDYGITGNDQIIAVTDSGLDIDNCYFYDSERGIPDLENDYYDPDQRKVIAYYKMYEGENDWDSSLFSASLGGHGTHVAGSAAGRNPDSPAHEDHYKGMAYDAKLIIQDFRDGLEFFWPTNLETMLLQTYEAGARFHSNSWGLEEEDGYAYPARDADNFLFDHPDMVVTWAAGNSGPEGTIEDPENCKNSITVGACHKNLYEPDLGLAVFSSRGPTPDGRMKPDMVAPGFYILSAKSDKDIETFNCETKYSTGTSMSTPVTAGYTALIRQYFMEGFYPSGRKNPDDAMEPSGALIKAALLNSCKELEYFDIMPPNNDIGWGRPLLEDVLYFEIDERNLIVFDEKDGINNNEALTYSVTVASSEESLKFTLAWYDHKASPQAQKELVNNIDFKVITPNGTLFSGNNFIDGISQKGEYSDDLNNVEGIHFNTPEQGNYRIIVEGESIPMGPQPYALVVTGAISQTREKVFIRPGQFLTPEGLWHIANEAKFADDRIWASGYGQNQCDRLYTPYFYLSPHEQTYLSFKTLYDMNTGFDGGVIQVSTGMSEEWEVIEPDDSLYPGRTGSDSKSCIGTGVRCFSGTLNDWRPYTFDLTSYMGQSIALSFLFGTDDKGEADGWFIDDIEAWRYSEGFEIENSFGSPIVQCRMNEDSFSEGDFLEAMLVYDNPFSEDVEVDVYCALMSGSRILLWIGEGYSPDVTYLSKKLASGSVFYESLLVFPVSAEMKGDFKLLAAVTRMGTLEIYGNISSYSFSIR